VVRLVVEDEDVLHRHQFRHDALEHLPVGLERVELGGAALEELPAAAGQVDPLAQVESVVVRDDDLRLAQLREYVRGDQLAALAIAVGRPPPALVPPRGTTPEPDCQSARPCQGPGPCPRLTQCRRPSARCWR
jgi:hypothetical protein